MALVQNLNRQRLGEKKTRRIQDSEDLTVELLTPQLFFGGFRNAHERVDFERKKGISPNAFEELWILSLPHFLNLNLLLTQQVLSQGAFHRELGVSPDPSKKTAAFTNRPPTLTSIASQPRILEDFSTYSLAQEAFSGTVTRTYLNI